MHLISRALWHTAVAVLGGGGWLASTSAALNTAGFAEQAPGSSKDAEPEEGAGLL